jgi:putative transposase
LRRFDSAAEIGALEYACEPGFYAFTVFERIFKDFGLPAAIRTDNGVPFASPNSLFGLSKLSVWWLRLRIEIERIKPSTPNCERLCSRC